jgi:hypothetical protein
MGTSLDRLGTYGHFTAVTHGHARLLLVTPKPLQSLMIRENSLERVTGIEPAWPAWKAGALPLSYTRVSLTRLEQVYVTGEESKSSYLT